jgi:CspA family cold shock protein
MPYSSAYMFEGIIARIMDKGFGFIAREGQDKELFFHASELQNVAFDDLREGDKVSFDIVDDGEKGPRAVAVNKIEAQAQAA